MNLLNFIKRILARFINIPRKIRQVYYIIGIILCFGQMVLK